MPRLFVEGPYRFFFYASDRTEPPHVHVERDENKAKFWLAPVSLEKSIGFRGHELRVIERIVAEKQQRLLDDWHEYFGE